MRLRAIACMVAVMGLATPARAESEVRTFAIFVDGRRAGDERLTIDARADGRTIVTSETDIKVRVLLYTFRYVYRGEETWQKGRLTRLESTCNDDGKRFTLHATARDD